jgi:hypothetical protein
VWPISILFRFQVTTTCIRKEPLWNFSLTGIKIKPLIFPLCNTTRSLSSLRPCRFWEHLASEKSMKSTGSFPQTKVNNNRSYSYNIYNRDALSTSEIVCIGRNIKIVHSDKEVPGSGRVLLEGFLCIRLERLTRNNEERQKMASKSSPAIRHGDGRRGGIAPTHSRPRHSNPDRPVVQP